MLFLRRFLTFMKNALPQILLTAIVGIITFSGCYQPPTTPDQSTAQLPDPMPQYRRGEPQLPDTALFPIVNIYGEVRPAIYRAGESRANFSFQQHTSTDEGHDADVILHPRGKCTAFSRPPPSDPAHIYLQRVHAPSAIHPTHDPAHTVHPSSS